jgi:hypothetical protein
MEKSRIRPGFAKTAGQLLVRLTCLSGANYVTLRQAAILDVRMMPGRSS